MKRLGIIALFFSCAAAMAQSPRDTAEVRLSLDASAISESYRLPLVENSIGVSGAVNVEKIRSIPTFLGNADPLSFVRLLPSVQVNTEIDGGLYMHGCENSHTLISIGNVPIYGASHLLGLFSVFNSSHYTTMSYSTSAGRRNRLGGHIDMALPDSLVRKTGGDFSLGLLSAQGTLRIPTSSKTSLFLSARKTFINLLYGQFLQYCDQPLSYGFTDGNLTFLWKPGPRDKIWVEMFAGRDNANMAYSIADAKILGSWFNMMGSLHWNHYWSTDVLKQTLYYTGYGLDGTLESEYMSGEMPSRMKTAGYLAQFIHNDFSFGADIAWHEAMPQNPDADGFASQSLSGLEKTQRGLESTLSASYSRLLGHYMNVKVGLSGTWYLDPEKHSHFGLSPEAETSFLLGKAGKMSLRYGIHRQYIFQTGVTNTGLPLEFWALSGKTVAPQWSGNLSLSHNKVFGNGAWSASVELYHKQLFNQVEYFGTPFEIISTNYTLENFLYVGKGTSMGVNLMLQKQKGHLTGWMSYSFNRSRRSFDNPEYPGLYPSEHERPHELDMVVTYDWGKFDFGGTFIAASGTPYTPPESFYVLGERIFTTYGEHNSGRLPAYIRLDLSVNIYFRRTARAQRGLNLSVYNALNRKNAVGFGTHYNYDDNTFELRPTTFTSMVLPSLSYFHKF